MGSRTERAGGTLRIATAPGEGTVVSMTVPF
jgi:signal transduction histidine kinase